MPACLHYFINKYPPKEETINSVFYFFSNGFDEELRKIEAWKSKIFNDSKYSFNFIFLRSAILNKIQNKAYTTFLKMNGKILKKKQTIYLLLSKYQ